MNSIVLKLLFLYKKFVSVTLTNLFGGGCRFEPTCSVYAAAAISKYGIIKGSFLVLKRIVRCHPFSNGGYDPIT